MSFRGREDSGLGNMNKMEPGDRKFGGGDLDKGDSDDRPSGFDPGRGRRPPPFGRGRRPSPPGRDKPFGDRPRDFGGYGRNDNDFPPPGGRDMMRDRSPVHGPEERYSDRFKKNDRREEPVRKEGGRPPYYEEPPRDRYGGMEGRGGYPPSRFEQPPTDFKHRPTGYSAPPPKDFADGFPKPNECEIIAMNRQQRLYAESVESRIKALGVLVDVLFLKDEALLTQTIDDIARKGSLYALVISPQNETHGSVTVNILHGTPQEHRNMPLEDALRLVGRNFGEFARGQRERVERERAERGPYSGAVPADREVQLLLRMLADGRWASPAEIDAVLRYLTERRDKMRGEERLRPEPPAPSYAKPPPAAAAPALKDDPDVAQKEQDLQNRIINLMNQGAPPASAPAEAGSALRPAAVPARAAPDAAPPPAVPSAAAAAAPFHPAAKSEAASTATYINFDNPSVQKALDNLMQSGPNLLKSISLGGLSSASPAAAKPPASAPSGADPRPGMGGPRGGDVPGRGVDMMGSASRAALPGLGGPSGMDAMASRAALPGRGYGEQGMSRMGQQRATGQQDMGQHPPMGMSRGGGAFPFNKYQGPPPGQQQQGASHNFPPFGGAGNMGGMPPRPSFGGPQGMMGPRRF